MEFDLDLWIAGLRREINASAEGSPYLSHELDLLAERNSLSIYEGLNPYWLMDHNERAGLYMILGLTKPKVVIEIGARFAGSTYLFSQFADTVHVIDIDPALVDRCAGLKNVHVHIGDSTKLVPRLLAELEGWDFALVDGDHTPEGVRNDLNAFLGQRPARRCHIVMHDSFNPACRKGILEADWDHPWVHFVEVDFTMGNLMPQPHVHGQMWGGLAVAELSPQDRKGKLEIKETGRLMFDAALRNSGYIGGKRRLANAADDIVRTVYHRVTGRPKAS